MNNVLTIFKWNFLLLLVLSSVGCDDGSRHALKVGTNIWPGYESLYLARSQKLFAESDIKLIELVSASDVISALRNRRIDVAALTLDEAISLYSEGFDLGIFLIMDVSMGADALVVRAEIEHLSDLQGKRIGSENTALGALMMSQILKAANLTLDDINNVNIPVNEHYSAFNENQLDGVVTFEPVLSKLLGEGQHKLFDSSELPGLILDVLVVDKSVIGHHEQDLKLLVRAHFEALQYLKEHREQAIKIMSKRLRIPPWEVDASLDGLMLADKKTNLDYLLGTQPEYAIEKTLNTIQQSMLDAGLLDNKLDLSEFVITDYVLSN